MRSKKLGLRLIQALQGVTAISLFWADFGDLWWPEDTTRPEMIIILILLIIWEEVLRIKHHLKVE